MNTGAAKPIEQPSVQQMRERIRLLIERELTRLDTASKDRGLDGSEIRSLELLVKTFREFAGDNAAKEATQSVPLEDLLDGIVDE